MTPEEAAEAARQKEAEQLATTDNQANAPVVTGTTVPPGHEATPENSAPRTDTATLELLRNLQRQNQELIDTQRRQADELHALRNPPAPPKTKEQETQEYFDNPQEVIRRNIEAALAPLNQRTQQTQRQQDIARFTDEFSRDPRFAKHWNRVSDTVGQFVAQTPNITRENFQAIVFAAIGAAETGFIPSKNPEIVTGSEVPVPLDGSTSRTANVSTPPNVRPSAPAAPRPTNEGTKRTFTELERRMMREQNLTEEQWVKYMEASPNEVLNIKEKKK